jgi:hypothetical protein
MHPAYTLGTILAACLVALPCTAAVLADPAYVTFTAPQQSVVVKLSNDGVPVSAAGIGNWQLMASGHDYKHMLQLAKDGRRNHHRAKPDRRSGQLRSQHRDHSGPGADSRLHPPE